MHSSNQNAKSIKERLSNAIWNINFKKVKCLVEQGGKDITQLVLSEALQKANERIAGLKEGDKKQDQEDRLTQITGLLEKKFGNIGAEVAASSVGGEFSATTSDQEILVNVGNEEKQTPDQPTEQTTLQTGDEQEPGSEGGQQNPPRPSSLSLADDSENGRGSGSPFSLVGTPSGTNGSDNEYVEVFPKDVEGPTLRSSGSPQGIQPEALPSASSNIGNIPTTGEPAVVTANVEGGNGQFTGEDDQDLRPTPAPVPKLTSAPDDRKQPGSTGKNDPASQNAKGSKWPVVAASVLAIAGIALGVAIAVHLEMLAVGIAVGACCLVAAAIMYYCAPKSSVEYNKVEKGLHPEKGSVSV